MNFLLGCVFGILLGICLADQNRRNPICLLPADPGLCLALFPRFYYNEKEGKCLEFTYGGCQGNANNFLTAEECMNRCAWVVERSGEETQSDDACSGGPVPGRCEAYMPSYYYDSETGSCKSFIYGGCEGSSNRYATEEECLKQCKETQSDDPCSGGPVTGPCKAYMPSYYYDSDTGTCKSFVYGGCQGSSNRYKTKEECLKKCKGESARVSDICSQDKQPGTCSSQIKRYYFNKETRKCESFVYTGCGGNDNNFLEFECERTCPGDLDLGDVCGLEKKVGPCRARKPRYYFNRETGQCEEFNYGGCSGNYNNFEKREECESYCKE